MIATFAKPDYSRPHLFARCMAQVSTVRQALVQGRVERHIGKLSRHQLHHIGLTEDLSDMAHARMLQIRGKTK